MDFESKPRYAVEAHWKAYQMVIFFAKSIKKTDQKFR